MKSCFHATVGVKLPTDISFQEKDKRLVADAS